MIAEAARPERFESDAKLAKTGQIRSSGELASAAEMKGAFLVVSASSHGLSDLSRDRARGSKGGLWVSHPVSWFHENDRRPTFHVDPRATTHGRLQSIPRLGSSELRALGRWAR